MDPTPLLSEKAPGPGARRTQTTVCCILSHKRPRAPARPAPKLPGPPSLNIGSESQCRRYPLSTGKVRAQWPSLSLQVIMPLNSGA
eukprot:652570-Hanusia_phi.AAC.1